MAGFLINAVFFFYSQIRTIPKRGFFERFGQPLSFDETDIYFFNFNTRAISFQLLPPSRSFLGLVALFSLMYDLHVIGALLRPHRAEGAPTTMSSTRGLFHV